jgi:hypothetical protein
MRRRLLGSVLGQPAGGGGGGFGLTFIGLDFDAGNSSPTLSVSTTSTSNWKIVIQAIVGTAVSGSLLINGSSAPTPLVDTTFTQFLQTRVYAIPGNVASVSTSGETYASGSALLAVYELSQDYGVALDYTVDNQGLVLNNLSLWDNAVITPDAGGSILGVINTRNETVFANPGLFGTIDENRLDYNTGENIRLFHLNDALNQAYSVTNPTTGTLASGVMILIAFDEV